MNILETISNATNELFGRGTIMRTSQDLVSVPEVVVIKTAAATAVSGGSLAVFGGYTLNELAVIVGIVVGVGGLVVQVVLTAHTIWSKNKLLSAQLKALKAGATVEFKQER